MREVKGSMRAFETRLLLLLLRRSGSGRGGDCFFDSSDFGLDARLDPVKRIVMRTHREEVGISLIEKTGKGRAHVSSGYLVGGV